LASLKKHGKKRTRINRKQVSLKKSDIARLIKEEVAKQNKRETQQRRGKD
jgi:hypothetical protein